MDITLLKKLICLNCYSPNLKYKENALVCLNCGQDIPLNSGIPNFLSRFQIGEISWKEKNSNPYAYESMILQMKSYRIKRIDEPLLQYVQGEVLEIGCGTCRLAPLVEKQGGMYFGLDPALSFLLYAYNHRKLQRLVCGQGERLPFQDNSFDCIISGFYSYRYVNPELGLPEARRVLKSGCRFIFDLLNYWVLKLIELKYCFKNKSLKGLPHFKLQPQPNTFEFTNLSQLEQKAKKTGFLVEDVISTPVTPIFPALNKYFSNFYYRGKRTVYLGYDVIIILKAI